MTRTTYLQRLARSVGPGTFAQVLHQHLYFPKTKGKFDGKVTICQETLDFAAAITDAQRSADLVASGNMEDVTLVLQGLQDLVSSSDIHLGVFDSIIVKRSGIPIMRVVQTSQLQTGRSVHVDIHGLSKTLMETKSALDKLSWWNNPFIVASTTVAVCAMLVAVLAVAQR